MIKKASDEVSDAELLAEIENDVLNGTINANLTNNENIPINNNETNMNLNDTINGAKMEYEGAQLTTFQDNIITTGSDVSILLMVILLILFLIQMVRKTYNYFTLQSKIQKVVNPLDDAKPMAAEHLTPINPGYDHKSYAVYNTEFGDRNLYLQKRNGGAPASILKEILLKRAVKCIEKARAMQRDGVGIRKNWNMDLLPRDVWDDFNAAQRNIQAEIECVVQENQRLQFQWGPPHKNNIFSKAKQLHQQKVIIQNKVFHQKMQLKHQQQQQQQQQGNKKKNNAPNSQSFGNGLNTGFFNSNHKDNKSKPLTKKEKNELKRQKKAMKNSSNNQPNMLQNNIENPTNSNNSQYQQTQPRRRKKQKHRFANK